MEQHASLCVELAALPERAAETLARYRLTLAQKEIADRHFHARFANEPGLRATWDRAYRTYQAWYLERMRPKR